MPGKSFSRLKYGLFVHYVYELSPFSDGSFPQSLDAFADHFDVTAFADSVEKMSVEYVILTAWHYRMRPLYPSAVTERWRPGNSCKRDLLGEIIDALKQRGISVILYTHPRDGHDFTDPDRLATGWGLGSEPGRMDTPDPARFSFEKWNRYVDELYAELAQRYGKKLLGFYTDGVGPTRGRSVRAEENRQIVDYLMIRDIMKKENPNIVMIQNYFGYLFSDDYAMPEGFFGYEDTNLNTAQWPSCRKALAICPFEGGWWPQPKPRGEDARKMSVADMLQFLLFNASCTAGGGICWASGPYCEGGLWPAGVEETMQEVGRELNRFRESILNAVPSRCYPTVSGDTLVRKGYCFFTGSEDGKYEYLHILRMPESRELLLGEPADGALLSDAVSLTPDVTVKCDASGKEYRIKLKGKPDPLATVIRFCREAPEKNAEAEWINDTDKRIRYDGAWTYCYLKDTEDGLGLLAHGCFEADYHKAERKGDSLFLAFNGSVVELICNTRPNNGSADLFIDSVAAGRIETDAPTTVRKTMLRSIDLHGGWHTLHLVLREDRPFELDAIRVIP